MQAPAPNDTVAALTEPGGAVVADAAGGLESELLLHPTTEQATANETNSLSMGASLSARCFALVSREFADETRRPGRLARIAPGWTQRDCISVELLRHTGCNRFVTEARVVPCRQSGDCTSPVSRRRRGQKVWIRFWCHKHDSVVVLVG